MDAHTALQPARRKAARGALLWPVSVCLTCGVLVLTYTALHISTSEVGGLASHDGARVPVDYAA